jgi:hypothetical protein
MHRKTCWIVRDAPTLQETPANLGFMKTHDRHSRDASSAYAVVRRAKVR